MSALINQLDRIVQKTNWPIEHRTTMQSRRIYEDGLDMVNSFRGHPKVFVEALQIFQATRSCPYAYAGIAYTLNIAAWSENKNQYGLQKAMKWLEKSQNLEPDRPEINFIEAVIYINTGQYENSRLILNYLTEQDSQNYYVCATEVYYWREQKDEDKCHHWLKQAVARANNSSRYAFVMNSLANFYLERELYEYSIEVYKRVAKVGPDDPWLWHNMSVAYVNIERFKEAEQCNKRALALMDFGAAREIEQIIKKNRGGLSRFFRR